MHRRVVVLGLAVLLVVLGSATPVAGQLYLISLDPTNTMPADGESSSPRISADGRRIVFVSKAKNLVPGDTSGKQHIYLWDDRGISPVIVRVSADSAGVPANGPSDNPSISPDGVFIAFNSTATNLGAPPTGGWSNVYVRGQPDRPQGTGPLPAGVTYWVSQTYPGATGRTPNSHCGRPSMSGVGQVAFECLASNMVANDTNGCTDVFVANLDGTNIARVSTTSSGAQAIQDPTQPYESCYSQYPAISANGTRIVFESYASTLIAGDTNHAPDVFVKNTVTRELRRVNGAGGVQPGASSLRPAISADGRFVAFESQAVDMVQPKTPGGIWQIYRVDLDSTNPDAVRLVSARDRGGFRASLNHDGSKVAFEHSDEIFLWDEGTTDPRFVTKVATTTSGQTNGPSHHASLAPSTADNDPATPEGMDYVVWSSLPANLTQWNIFVRGVARVVQYVEPATVVAAPVPPSPSPPPSKAIFTKGEIRGRGVGEDVYINMMAWDMLWGLAGLLPYGDGLRAAATAMPTVTVGGVGAMGVTMPDANTLRFTAPLLPAGSSNTVVIRYADGEVVTLPVPLKAMALVPNSTTDSDKDTLPDWYELTYGLDPLDAADATTVQANGLTPVQSLAQQHNPTATTNRYLAEGATGSMFLTRIALANPDVLPASAFLRFLKRDKSVQSQTVTVPPMGRTTVDVEGITGMGNEEFATTIESDLPLLVDRTMRWTKTARYGSHAERSVPGPSLIWYLAEGATHSGFDLFYLLQNPGTTKAEVEVRYLLPSGPPLVKYYGVGPSSRENIWVDLQDPILANTDVSAVIRSTNGVPIIVERAMYATGNLVGWAAGHESAGVTAPNTEWFLAEGATGSLFDLFVLIANPNDAAANVTATYLFDDGTVLAKDYVVKPNSRFNIWVDYEHPRLAQAAVSTLIRSTNGVPVIVERAMWWPGSGWYEAHNSPGSTTTGTKWGLAEGEVGGADDTQTYILIANTSSFAGQARVTLLFEDGTTSARTVDLMANSRTNVPVGFTFGAEASGKRFGAVVESLPSAAGTPQIVVERAMYASPGGLFWSAGTNALATKLQ